MYEKVREFYSVSANTELECCGVSQECFARLQMDASQVSGHSRQYNSLHYNAIQYNTMILFIVEYSVQLNISYELFFDLVKYVIYYMNVKHDNIK